MSFFKYVKSLLPSQLKHNVKVLIYKAGRQIQKYNKSKSIKTPYWWYLPGSVQTSNLPEYRGIRYKVSRFNQYRMYVLNARVHEPGVTQFLAQQINPKQTPIVFDIGANIGMHTLYIAKLLSNATTKTYVYAFEPWSRSFNNLSANIRLNRFENVRIVPEALALSDKVEQYTIYSPKQGKKWRDGFVTRVEHDLSSIRTEQMEATTLDIFCNLNQVYPNFIKIDVEGAEQQVIDGAYNTLKTHQPMLLVEVHRARINVDLLVSTLQQHNYEISWIDKNHLIGQASR